ncbi:MAG: type IX secretion system outer membrane channel protein PorV [Tannerellaceae bacterium]|jgi:hypothetical protein|nr:type IX secretion system outer membrane channel protein PorV [Tannerellaceae bacterium]
MNKLVFPIFAFLLASTYTRAQFTEKNGIEFAPINTAIPSLTIAPDARGGSMGDNGIATPPDVNAQFWNPSKNAFQYSQAGVALSYTPWLRKLVSDVALACLSGYYKIGDNDLQAIGGSLRYFTLGAVQDSRNSNDVPIFIYPYEMALDVNYSRKLTEEFAMGVALRFVRSDMGVQNTDEMFPDNAYAADVSGYGERYIVLGASESLWSYGFNISNIGTKISYDGGTSNQFLPARLHLGTGILYPLDEYNRIGFYLDLSKYLVPSEPLSDMYESDEAFVAARDKYNNTGSINGIFRSFSDSPGGLSGELKEIMASIGVEYTYDDRFFLRGGYYHENENMGNRRYFSAGAGFRMNVFQLDAAYLISTVPSNPLDQTLRLTLSFDMDGIKALFR